MTREGECCPFNTLNPVFPSVLKLPPLIRKCKHISCLKLIIYFLGFFSHLCCINACGSLDPSFPVTEGWDDFWLQDYGLNSPTLVLSELLLCSLWSPSLAGSFRCVPQQKPQHGRCLVLGLQRLSQYNVSAPVLIEMFLSLHFLGTCGVSGSAHKSSRKGG